jgi:hypothetical protein
MPEAPPEDPVPGMLCMVMVIGICDALFAVLHCVFVAGCAGGDLRDGNGCHCRG